jgi:hypothetical protein
VRYGVLEVSFTPTAAHEVGPTQETLSRDSLKVPAVVGLDTTDQLDPFHRSVKVALTGPEGSWKPMAKQSDWLGQEMPSRSASRVTLGLAVGTMENETPFQRSVIGCSASEAL